VGGKIIYNIKLLSKEVTDTRIGCRTKIKLQPFIGIKVMKDAMIKHL